MDLTLPVQSLALLALALLAAGLLAGFVAGLLGIGGGAILVPALYEAFAIIGVDADYRMHLAVGTGLAVIVPTSLRSFVAHYRNGAVDFQFLRRMGPWAVIGVIAGSIFARYSSADALKVIWIVVASVIATRFLLRMDRWALGEDIPRSRAIEAAAVAIGFVSTLMSIGGGAFVTILMTSYGRSMHQAVGTSSGFGPLVALPGAIGFMLAGWGVPGLPIGSLGYVSLIGAALLVPASILAAPWGVGVAHAISRRKLELVFAGFLAFAVARFLYSLIA